MDEESAFGHLTGGQDIRLSKNEEAPVLMEDRIESLLKNNWELVI